MESQPKILLDFLMRLSEEPELYERYAKDPHMVLRDNGLSREAVEVVLSRKPEVIARFLGAASKGLVVIIIHVTVPGGGHG